MANPVLGFKLLPHVKIVYQINSKHEKGRAEAKINTLILNKQPVYKQLALRTYFVSNFQG